jgi:Ca2+:H+ antiporter
LVSLTKACLGKYLLFKGAALVSSATSTVSTYKPRPLRHRFRKAWRAVLFLALIPFFMSGPIQELTGFDENIVRFLSGVVVLIPLATFIEVVTEDLIERLGQLVGGLLHAFFGNVAYFTLTVTALITAANSAGKKDELVNVVQSSIAGTIVIDMLFILGLSIFIGGFRNGRMQFSAEYANQYAEMITVAVIALALPGLAARLGVQVGFSGSTPSNNIIENEAAILSDITAVILIIAYVGYLGWTVFKFRDKPAKPEGGTPEEIADELRGSLIGPLAEAIAPIEAEEQRHQLERESLASASTLKKEENPSVHSARSVVDIVNDRLEKERVIKDKQAKREARARNEGIAFWEIAILVLGTAGVVFVSERMASSLEEGFLHPVNGGYPLGMNPFFIGFIILPIASNMVELSAAVSAAWHDRMETCMAITAGSAIQVALLVAPALVLVGHIVGLHDMNLLFGLFVLAIFGLIAYLYQLISLDGETSWLEGLQFILFFAVIGVVAYFAGH